MGPFDLGFQNWQVSSYHIVPVRCRDSLFLLVFCVLTVARFVCLLTFYKMNFWPLCPQHTSGQILRGYLGCLCGLALSCHQEPNFRCPYFVGRGQLALCLLTPWPNCLSLLAHTVWHFKQVTCHLQLGRCHSVTPPPAHLLWRFIETQRPAFSQITDTWCLWGRRGRMHLEPPSWGLCCTPGTEVL